MPTVVNVLVRRAVEDDLDGILSVGHRTWPPTYEPIAGADYVAMGLAKWWSAESTLPAIRAGRMTVAELDGDVVGVASAGPHEGHLVLWKLYVVPEHQRGGIGARLLEAVVEGARGIHPEIRLAYIEGHLKGIRRMVDEVSVQPSDPEAGWLADEPDVAAPRRRNARGTAPNC